MKNLLRGVLVAAVLAVPAWIGWDGAKPSVPAGTFHVACGVAPGSVHANAVC